MNYLKNLICGASVCVMAAGVVSCSSQDDPMPGGGTDNSGKPNSCVAKINVSRTGYDDEPQTRSAEAWVNGDKIYLTFTADATTSHGEAVYNEGIWTVDYYGTLSKGEEMVCKAVYFENADFDNGSVVTLNPHTGIYEDLEGSYTFTGDELTVTANLKPKTGRIRFNGEAGEIVSVNGISHHTAYDAASGTFSLSDGAIHTSVDAESTPYIYGVYTEAESPRLNIITTVSAYTRMMPVSTYQAGESGYMKIPTPEAYEGWQNYAMFKVNGVEFKMIPVNYSEGNFLLAETETTEQLYDAVVSKKTNNSLKPQFISSGSGGSYYRNLITPLNMATNLEFRVPLLEEWQYAYIGGEKSQGYTYSGSNNIDEVAWYELNSKNTHNVKGLRPNELGFYDMCGNYAEMVIDSENKIYYYGGSYSSSAKNCTVSSSVSGTGGLRLALSVNQKAQAE